MRTYLTLSFLAAICVSADAYCAPQYGKLFASTDTPAATQEAEKRSSPNSAKPASTPAAQAIPEPPRQVIPSGSPATFAQQEAEERQKAEYEKYKLEQARQAQVEADKMKASQPTVIVVQQPQQEYSLLNMITSFPGLLLRSIIK